jgi:translation initiation factor 2 beta subunit (eIF-2beta)/eIF-5
MDGYHNINVRTNLNQSLFQHLKVENTPENEVFLYKKYFEKEIQQVIQKYQKKLPDFPGFSTTTLVTKPPKKVDIIRIEHMDKTLEQKRGEIFEFMLLEFCSTILQAFAENTNKHALAFYTLIQLKKASIPHTNKYIIQYVDKMVQYTRTHLSIRDVIHQAHEFIEKNPNLLKYEDMTLFQHQKQLFTIMKENPETPKLVLYIAPTGTGKTLSPLGLSDGYRIIFICVARHVGLALAKSAISMGKKIAFAFGCETASDIRLHYFAASNYTVNKRSGAIGKVDNSVGDKVEIMICDVQSYLTAMHYMLAFNEETNIITYWDEPTITMDYQEHELHEKIHENWIQNKISKVVLSCATLPKEQEIEDTLADFKSKFGDREESPEIHSIESYDCKKSIGILNKEGKCVLPHTIPEFVDYEKLMISIEHCEANKTLLRYFDLSEIIRYLEEVHRTPNILAARYHMNSYFADISDITMNTLKLYYLESFRYLDSKKWPQIHRILNDTQKNKFILHTNNVSNGKKVSSHGGESIHRIKSVQMVPTKHTESFVKIHSFSTSDDLTNKNVSTSTSTSTSTGILLTTSDAYTLTDGPTIFLAEDVEKIGKFYIQSSKIPPIVFERIMDKIEYNNEIQKKMEILQQNLEDKMGSNKEAPTRSTDKTVKKDRKDDRKEEQNPEIRRIIQQLDTLRSQIMTVNLDNVYVPNTPTHQQLWTNTYDSNAFAPNISEAVVKEIMELDVENNMKILLLLGIGMFTNSPHPGYMEVMKRLAYDQKLYIILASSDYIYGTNYAFCHGFIGKDLTNMTQQKIIQAMGRVGRNKIQQEYTVRFRDDGIMMKLFLPQEVNLEAINMNRLFSDKSFTPINQ